MKGWLASAAAFAGFAAAILASFDLLTVKAAPLSVGAHEAEIRDAAGPPRLDRPCADIVPADLGYLFRRRPLAGACGEFSSAEPDTWAPPSVAPVGARCFWYAVALPPVLAVIYVFDDSSRVQCVLLAGT